VTVQALPRWAFTGMLVKQKGQSRIVAGSSFSPRRVMPLLIALTSKKSTQGD
jgi:hypothetical protein